MVTAGLTILPYQFIWQLKIPPTVRVYAYLFLHGRLLTHDVMNYQGLNCDSQRVVCQHCSLETAPHLFFHCSNARTVWTRLSIMLGVRFLQSGDTVQELVDNSLTTCRNKISRDQWGSYFFAVCWCLWRGCNKHNFEGTGTDSRCLVQYAVKEAKLWMKHI